MYMHTLLAEYFHISMHTWLPVFQVYLHCHGLMGEPRKSWADLEKILRGRAKHGGHKSCSV